ncbi:hypothetical protein HUJ04_001416 [Dendroctonus ponderosae]|nr:hypothetical protein HUJ04_001416 [Dendroctonus ponderosae]
MGVEALDRFSKTRRAARGVSILIRKDWKSKINNWEAVYENILTVNLKVHGYNIIILAAYTLSEDERVGIKQEIVEKLDETLEDVIKPEQWLEHYKGLLQETRQEYIIDSPGHITVHGEEIEISEKTVKETVKNLKSGQASGSEGIYSEMLKFGTEKLFRSITTIISKCLNGHPVPQDWKTAFISSIHKNGNKIRKIMYGQHLCTYEKHIIPVSRLWKVLERTNINHNLIKAPEELNKDSKSRIRTGKELTDIFIVNKGLSQRLYFSPTFFKVYVAVALRNWKRKINGMGVEIDDRCLFALQFADDQFTVASDRKDMQYMDGNVEVDNSQEVLLCQECDYLGITFDNTGTDVKEIEKRLVKAKKQIGYLNGILWSKEITTKRKFNIYERMVKSSILYEAETWRVTDRQKKKVDAVEMHAIIRYMPISRRDRIRNDHIKQEMGIEGTIVQDIEK